ncbi:MAG: Nif11 family protein [Ectothiorhodospiraceae bacterium]|nr:Nif11 family protein [Ectothiorhodospiraceae bacterium]
MSQDAVRALMREVQENAALRDELERALASEKPVSAFLTVASGRGHEFSAEDLVNALGTADQESLDDAALEAVVGGAGRFTSFTSSTLNVFRNYTFAPRIGQIGPGFGGVQEVEEEEIQL